MAAVLRYTQDIYRMYILIYTRRLFLLLAKNGKHTPTASIRKMFNYHHRRRPHLRRLFFKIKW